MQYAKKHKLGPCNLPFCYEGQRHQIEKGFYLLPHCGFGWLGVSCISMLDCQFQVGKFLGILGAESAADRVWEGEVPQ